MLNFRTLQSSQLARIKEPTQVLPYMKFNKHITPSNGLSTAAPGESIDLASSSISLAVVPDRLMITIRVPLQYQNAAHAS